MVKKYSKNWRVWLILFMAIVLPSAGYSDNPKQEEDDGGGDVIFIDGFWSTYIEQRSLDVPFTAYLKGNVITILHKGKAIDFTVTIIRQDTGDEVYYMYVPSDASDYICVPMLDIDSGSYRLVISNPEAGYLFGDFNL